MPFINLKRLADLAIDLVYPLRCIGCSETGSLLCPSCRERLPQLTPPLCPRCSLPLPLGGYCRACRDQPPITDGVRSAFAMDGLARDMVHGLKYRGWRALAAPMGALMADAMDDTWAVDIVAPVPLHRRRIRERGFNQAEELARAVADRLGVPMAADALERLRHSPPQARSASAIERRLLVRDAFAVGRRSARGRRVLLVDDVCTTGATLDACATALRGAGAAAAFGLTFAREL